MKLYTSRLFTDIVFTFPFSQENDYNAVTKVYRVIHNGKAIPSFWNVQY